MSLSTIAYPQPSTPPQARFGWGHASAVVVLLVLAWVMAIALTPRQRMADQHRDVVLETQLPRSFGDWRVDEAQMAAVVNPQQESLLKVLYSQTLARTYVNGQGERVMLSIAYGGTQGGGLELHRPEVCYVAQGFALEKGGVSHLSVAGAPRAVPLQRLMAHQRNRHEPISYWMRVGDDLMVSGLQQQLSRVRQGLQGRVPDGVLMRVSSISSEPRAAYALQDRFIQDLMRAASPALQRFLVGPEAEDASSQQASVSSSAVRASATP